MYALVKENDSAYFSMVFGYHCRITSKDDYQQYLQGWHNQTYIVLNREKSRLIQKKVFPSGKKYLDPMVLIVNVDNTHWVELDDTSKSVDFLTKYTIDSVDKEISEEDLRSCIELDAAFSYPEIQEISDQHDIDNFYECTGYLHDAWICKTEKSADSIHLTFDGVWGCKVEIWFDGDLSYSMESRESSDYDPSWYGSTLFFCDGYIYLVDEENMTKDDITNGFCWFKAKKMKYRIEPRWA